MIIFSNLKSNSTGILFLAMLCCAAQLWAVPSAPDWGADAIPGLFSPGVAGSGMFTTSTGGAPFSGVNPAQAGEAQRITIDVGYFGITGLGSGAEPGFGNAFLLGYLHPTRFGVFGGSMRVIQSGFGNFPVGTGFSANLNAAKEVFPRMSVGIGLNFGVGIAPDSTLNGENETWWNASADLGWRWNIGRVGPLTNFTVAATLSGLGISWYPTWLTPAGGVSFDFLHIERDDGRNDPLRLSFAADLGLPSLFYFPRTSLLFRAGVRAEIAETVTVSLSWPGGSGLNARELAEGHSGFTALPAIGVGVNFSLPSRDSRIIGGRLPTDGDLMIDTVFKPLYHGVTAIGAGASWYVGIRDRRPPVIRIGRPMEYALYFSPNNDGLADYVEIPLSITDERFVASWDWEIRNEEGEIVRTIRNRELRPQTINFRNLWNNLFSVREHVEVPAVLRWDGIAESGELSPDGRYFFSISATDDSGNRAMIPSEGPGFPMVLRNTPPQVAVAPMTDVQRIFSPGGARGTITFVPQGSYEEVWESGIYNSAGVRVRTFETESGNPQPREWDGRNDDGIIVNDGVYTFRISVTDRAMNSANAFIENIIVNTIRPVVSVVINDPWFSPNDDGVRDTVGMDLNVPVRDEVTGWTMRITDRAGAVQRTISGGPAGGVGTAWTAGNPGSSAVIVYIPARLEFDGRNDAGAVLREGEFLAELSVTYLNGFVASAVSPIFNLRLTPPAARIHSDFTAFSPNFGGVQSEMIILQEGSAEQFWIGEIRRAGAAAGEAPIRSFRFAGSPPAEIRWDGHTDTGAFAEDGEYEYRIFTTDLAGNTGTSNTLRFRLSTIETPIMITTDTRAFSPNGDGVRDTINFIPHIQVPEGVVSFRVDVLDSEGNEVRTFEGNGMPPAAISWDGRNAANIPAPEGFFTARLDIRYEQGNLPTATSLPFELDITPPRGSVSVPFTLFSPNGRRSPLPFNIATELNDEWTATITGAAGEVRTWNWTGAAPEIAWNGRDNAGNAVPDGTYTFTMRSTDAAGNSTTHAVQNIVLDARVPSLILTSSSTGIAPASGQTGELVRFGVISSPQDGIESWTLELKDEAGGLMRRFNSPPPGANGMVSPPPANISWNGLTEGGGIREGRFTPVMTINYLRGDVVTAEAAPILVHVSGPELVFNSHPRYFSPDNDGVDDELYINLVVRSPAPIASWYMEIREPEPPHLLFFRIEGRGHPAETIRWDGRSNRGELVQSATDYPVIFSATDVLGNTTTIEAQIGVDVLVIRDGDILRIQIPSIVFRPNFADFVGIPSDQLENNFRVLRRIAEILNRFRDYRIVVEGHANPITRTAAEERNELQPLSAQRARMVMDRLIEFGVGRNRLSYVGRGGTRPVVPWEDRDNWWKNRRVEFILER